MSDITLYKLAIGFQQTIASEVLDPKAEVLREWYSENLLLCVRAFILAENVGEKYVSYPADWLQAFKERWFPKWALAKWPVVYKTHKFSFSLTYPGFMPAMPEREHRLRIDVQDWFASDNDE